MPVSNANVMDNGLFRRVFDFLKEPGVVSRGAERAKGKILNNTEKFGEEALKNWAAKPAAERLSEDVIKNNMDKVSAAMKKLDDEAAKEYANSIKGVKKPKPMENREWVNDAVRQEIGGDLLNGEQSVVDLFGEESSSEAIEKYVKERIGKFQGDKKIGTASGVVGDYFLGGAEGFGVKNGVRIGAGVGGAYLAKSLLYGGDE